MNEWPQIVPQGEANGFAVIRQNSWSFALNDMTHETASGYRGCHDKECVICVALFMFWADAGYQCLSGKRCRECGDAGWEMV